MKLNQLFSTLILIGIIFSSCNSENEKKVESPIEASIKQPVKIVYNALTDFELKKTTTTVPFYKDVDRNALAIDASIYKAKYAAAFVKFEGESGNYDVKFTSLKEINGESTYRIKINNALIAEIKNPESDVDFDLNIFSMKKIKMEKGQIVEIIFNSHSNGKIAASDGFAFSRGRWREISFSKVD